MLGDAASDSIGPRKGIVEGSDGLRGIKQEGQDGSEVIRVLAQMPDPVPPL